MPDIGPYLKSLLNIPQQEKSKSEEKAKLSPEYSAVVSFQAALDKAAIVAVTDQEGLITYVNENFCSISGYSKHELIAADHRLLNSGHHTSGFMLELWSTILKGQVWKGEIKNKNKNGEYYWTDTTIVPVNDPANNKYQFIEIQNDITARKLAEERLEKTLAEVSNYKNAIDQSSLVVITDHQGIITYVNDNFCHISQYSRQELENREMRLVNSGYHSHEFFATMWATISQGRIWKGEIRNRAKDGSIYWVDTTIVPFMDEKGEPFQYVSIRSDITARKLSEENEKMLTSRMKIKEREFSDLLARINDGFIMVDRNFRYTYANAMAGRLTGLDPASLIGKNIWDVFPDAVGSETYKAFMKAFDEQTFQFNSDYYPQLDLWQENFIYPSEEGLSVFIRDVSAQKKSERDFRSNERIYKTIASNIPGSLFTIIDKNLVLRVIEGDLISKLGFNRTQFLNRTLFEAVTPDRIEFLMPLVQGAFTGEYQVVETLYMGHYLHYRFVPLKNENQEIDSVMLAAFDMTEQRSSQSQILQQYKEIINNEHRFKALIENISDGILLLNQEGLIQYQSPSAERITGFYATEALNRSIYDFLPEEFRSEAADIYRDLLHRPGETIQSTFKMMHKGGQQMWIEGSISNLLNDESVQAIIMNFRDVTERRHAEQQKQRSEAKLRTIFNNTKVAYVLLDTKYKVISYNPLAKERYEREIGLQLNENSDILAYLHDKREPEILQMFRQVMAGEKINYEIYFNQLDGGKCWYHVDMFPVRDEQSRVLGMIISSEDITQRKIADLEKERMTADILHHNKNLEQFAYIVSHNLRSPVANIIGLSNIIKENGNLSDADFERCLSGLADSAAKLDGVITDLNFILQSRRQIDERKEQINFEELLDNIVTSMGDQPARQKVTIKHDFKVPGVFSVRGYLHSIFINLITNSIKYRNRDTECQIQISSGQVNDHVVLRFSDNGLGIDMSRHGDKIFGLYKKFHHHVEGKGMGLYMVKSQVEILGGKISVQSELGSGTEFTIELPL